MEKVTPEVVAWQNVGWSRASEPADVLQARLPPADWFVQVRSAFEDSPASAD